MTTIAVSLFRSQLLKFLKRVMLGEEVVIVSRGREVARLVPAQEQEKKAWKEIHEMRKKCKLGDVLSPLKADWKVLR